MPASSSHSDGETESVAPALQLPPNLERYLPPYLWRKLLETPPGQGLLLNVLSRLRSVLYLLSTYLPQHLVQETLRHPVPGQVHGCRLEGSLLFADVSGFTALSERLAVQGREGAEQLTVMINRHFDHMLEILAWSGGVLLKFAGDALLAYFPQQASGAHAQWAVRAAQRMLRAMDAFSAIETPLGPVALKMKVGLSSGSFWAASVGSAERMEYVIMGAGVERTMAAEGAATAGQVVVDGATAAACDPALCIEQAPDLFAVRPDGQPDLDSFEIKAQARRGRSAVSLMDGTDEAWEEIALVLRQIEALSPYLPAELAERIVAGAQERRVESEFRPTTVIFVNFTGFEDLLAVGQVDGEQVTRWLSDYFVAMHKVIARYGGVVTRIDPYRHGSKMLILFGAPVAHEDDPQRAVRAALEMNAELAGLNRRWCRALGRPVSCGAGPGAVPDGAPVQQRIGVTQGVTFAGQAGSSTRREYTVMGDDVNLSARLMSTAQPGQILISRRVHKSVDAHFRTTSLPAVRVKGKSEPIPIWQVDGMARAAQHLGAGPVLGRDAELAHSRSVVRQALAGQGQVLAIRGPAGVGKSCLAGALLAGAQDQGGRVFVHACASYTAGSPYSAWIALLEALAGIDPPDGEATRSDKLLRLVADLQLDPAGVASPLLSLLGLPAVVPPAALRPGTGDGAAPAVQPVQAQARPGLFERMGQKVTQQKQGGADLWQLARARQGGRSGQMWQRLETRVAAKEQARLLQALRGLLERLSARSPLVLCFEDAQWMDVPSRVLLQQVASQVRGWPLLFLTVERNERDETGPAAGTRMTKTIELEPLDIKGTAALAAHLLETAAGEDLPAGLTDTIYVQSGGNPLFIEEIVRWMQQNGAGRLVPADAGPGFAVSLSLQELVLSRLDGLPHPQRSAAKAASVVGNHFSRRDLAVLLSVGSGTPGDCAPGEGKSEGEAEYLFDSLSGLQEARLTVLLELGLDSRYGFRQTLMRELIYDTMSFDRRRELHARLVADLEDRLGPTAAQQAEMLAYHYELAAQWIPAARYLLVCGHTARRRHAHPQAAGHFRRALAALDRIPGTERPAEALALQAQAHEGLGDVATLDGDFAAARQDYDLARSILPDSASVSLASLLVKQALVLPTQGEADEARSSARQAWEMAQQQIPPAPQVVLAGAAAAAWLGWRDGCGAEPWIERAAPLAGAGGDLWTAGVAALLDDLVGRWTAAQAAYQAVDQPAGVALALCRSGDHSLGQGDGPAAAALYDRAVEVWEQEGDACGLALGRYRQAESCWRRADAAGARQRLQEALDLLDGQPAAYEDDRGIVRAALAAVDGGVTGAWPAWRWQRYDDAFRIGLLFRADLS